MNEININQLFQMLADALHKTSGIPILDMIFVIIIILVIAILYIAKYFYDKNKREAAADALNEKILKERSANLERIQSDASRGICANMEVAYKQDFNFMVEKIKNKDYAAIFPKISTSFYNEISTFVYREELTPEDRAGRIIITIRPIK